MYRSYFSLFIIRIFKNYSNFAHCTFSFFFVTKKAKNNKQSQPIYALAMSVTVKVVFLYVINPILTKKCVVINATTNSWFYDTSVMFLMEYMYARRYIISIIKIARSLLSCLWNMFLVYTFYTYIYICL